MMAPFTPFTPCAKYIYTHNLQLWKRIKKVPVPPSTVSAARSARRPVSDTSGPRYCTPLSRSQLPSWLHSELQVASRKIDLIVVHCTDTRATQSYTVEQLQRDHERRGFGKYPGYHFYIRRDGTLYNTRPLQLKGCHVAGMNAHSIGVCYEGGKAGGKRGYLS